MNGEDNFFRRSSSLNDICLYLKQINAWIHCWKVLKFLCSCSFIVPFYKDYIFYRFPNLLTFTYTTMHCVKYEPEFHKYYDKDYDFVKVSFILNYSNSLI